MTIPKWGFFALGVATGVVAVKAVRTPAFKKACASVIGAGLKLKDDAAAFAESVKEDAEDIIAEAKHNNSQAKAK